MFDPENYIDKGPEFVEQKFHEALLYLDSYDRDDYSSANTIITAVSTVDKFADFLSKAGNSKHVIGDIMLRIVEGQLHPFLWMSNHDMKAVHIMKQFKKYLRYKIIEMRNSIRIDLLLPSTSINTLWVVSRKSYSALELKEELC